LTGLAQLSWSFQKGFVQLTVTGAVRGAKKMNSALAKYNSELHFNHKKPWKTSDIKYLKQFYDKDTLTDISLALGRTYKTVANMAYTLRKAGDL
jgi:hypothetical protein